MSVLAPPKPAVVETPTTQANDAAQAAQAFAPRAPANFREAGLEPGTVEALIVKHLAVVGSAACQVHH